MRWIVALAACLACAPAQADVTEVHVAQQFSMGYLQYDVLRHQGMLAKHAALLGIAEPHITWVTYGGSDIVNAALESGAIDVGAGGVPSLLTLWSRTHGTAREVRAIAAMSREPALLNTRNPVVHDLHDLTDADRIAMPAVTISSQAVLLEMAAAREWGYASYNRLDYLTFSLPPEDASNGLLARSADFNASFSQPPWSLLQLRSRAVHTVLRSFDLVGDATTTAIWTTRAFHDANPKVYRALLDALEEASAFIATHPAEALEYYIADWHLSPADAKLLRDSMRGVDLGYSLTPRATMKWASFMYRIGRIKAMPRSWTDLVWPEIDDLDGS